METKEARSEQSEQGGATPPWERDLIEKLVLATTREQTRTRRWNIFFRFLIFGYFLALLVIALWGDSFSEAEAHLGDHTALIKINDLIAAEDQGVSADQIEAQCAAFGPALNSVGIAQAVEARG